jgi:pyruvate kinase
LPTRAEATDVANSILDGTDCVMLSGESAVGRFPEESVAMLARIAAVTEANRPPAGLEAMRRVCLEQKPSSAAEAIAGVVEHTLETVPCAAVFVPTFTGRTARMISRFKPAVWIAAFTKDRAVCHALEFSYGVQPIELDPEPEAWREYAAAWLAEHELSGQGALLVAGPSRKNPQANHRIEFLVIGAKTGSV